MKHNTFYVEAHVLEDYLRKYSRGLKTKDYEYHIALYAKDFFDRQLKQESLLAFEVNNKQHTYPKQMKITAELLKEILRDYKEENTPVDFALAPVKDGQLLGYAYPFQIKKFLSEFNEMTTTEVADYINNKANHYRDSEVSMIIVPVNKVDSDIPKGFDINELKSKLKIDDKALHSVYIFQNIDGTAYFRPIWRSSRVIDIQ